SVAIAVCIGPAGTVSSGHWRKHDAGPDLLDLDAVVAGARRLVVLAGAADPTCRHRASRAPGHSPPGAWIGHLLAAAPLDTAETDELLATLFRIAVTLGLIQYDLARIADYLCGEDTNEKLAARRAAELARGE